MPSLRELLSIWISTPLDKASPRILERELARDAIAVLGRLRRLRAEASGDPPCLDKPTPFSRFLWDLGQAIKHTISENNKRAIRFVEVGVIETYIDLVKDKHFWTWDVQWRAVVLEILAVVVTFAQTDPAAQERIYGTTGDFFGHLWSLRTTIKLSDPGAQHQSTIDDTTMLATVVDAYYDIYRVRNRSPDHDTHIHHVHFLIWILSREDGSIPNIPLNPLWTTSLYSARGSDLTAMKEVEDRVSSFVDVLEDPSLYDVRDRFFRECILDVIGVNRVIDACEADLRDLLSHTDCQCESHIADLRVLARHVLGANMFLPTLHKRDLLGYALDILRNLFATGFYPPMCTNLCLFCFQLVIHYYAYHLLSGLKAAMPFQYPDFIDLLVAGVELAAGGCSSYVSRGDLHVVLVEITGMVMRQIERDTIECRGQLPEYVASLRLRAASPSGWYPSLQRLTVAAPKIEEKELNGYAPVSDVIECWAKFGAFIGLDAAEERKRYERGKQDHCNWHKCRKPSDGALDLRKCAGCGEARYCSRECQRLDWKEGGHKKLCRRLK
ncbi:unnamed protein product [Peniophora sp. CBMAI 1063]|nr:unnamed protein product [Peniophora sp. CBMAI 1063]